jgi:hypothetical protein
MPESTPVATLTTLRRLLLGILLVGLVGTATELTLMGHDEDGWQMFPLVVLAMAPRDAGDWGPSLVPPAFRAVMLLLMLSVTGAAPTGPIWNSARDDPSSAVLPRSPA